MKFNFRGIPIFELIKNEFGFIKGINENYTLVINKNAHECRFVKEDLTIMRDFMDDCITEVTTGIKGEDINVN
jgi:hypothetical protein